MNESIKQLLALQDRDLEIDRLRTDAAAIPAKVQAVKKRIDDAKAALENAKKDLTQLQLARKQKEIDLETQENAIRKHAGELNAVKSNDAYKALLGEIEKAKKDKSVLEDQILQVMEDTDKATRVWKEKEADHKNHEGELLKQIAELEAKKQALEQSISGKQTERAQLVDGYAKPLMEQYNRLRSGGRGAAVVPLRNEQCSGCHMRVSPNLVNEVRRGQRLMTCESCSRIVYLEEKEKENTNVAVQ